MLGFRKAPAQSAWLSLALCIKKQMENYVNHLNGSCLCGKVKFKLNSEIRNVVNCHCNFCRSHSGAAFSTYVALPHSALEITSGHDSLHSFQIRGVKKHFCRECGTPIFNLNDKYPGACMVYFGTFERSRDIFPQVNVWCESRLGWIDSLPSLTSVGRGVEEKARLG
ncbi:GFA family protein [Methylobacter sp. sgz302048]|jgi:hypothetical protein|uniref:GFA family protein n=1 Tax=Methylobacter sp. sgz302048 TaxID=3455945 RepID=UPI003F9F2372